MYLFIPHKQIKGTCLILDEWLGDATKVGLLKGLPEAESRLKLFEADIYNHSDFERPIEGCEYVFHLATPIHHHSQSTKVCISALQSFNSFPDISKYGKKECTVLQIIDRFWIDLQNLLN